MRERRVGFTLVELLIAIGIITVLMSILIIGTGFLRNKARVDATTMLIRRINIGLNEYNLVFSAYPPDEGDYEGSQNLYYFLGQSFDIEQGYDPATGERMKKKFGPALTGGFSKSEVNDQYIIDAWGKAMTYKNSEGKNNKSYVDIESAGTNGVFDDDDSPDDDDINNWKQDKYLSK
jgi:prepilin-type N-terminal cleavage/methylation domain-containing protein